MSTFVDPFDVAVPNGSENRTLGDDRIRELKRAIKERYEVEHSLVTATGAGSARHKFARGSTAGRPTDVVTGSIYFNTTTGKLEIWDGAAWQDATPAFLTFAGGLLTGALTLPNNVPLNGKDTTAVDRAIGRINASNVVQLGTTLLAMQLFASGNVSRWDGSNLHTIWDSGNDGNGSGLDADLIGGVAVRLTSLNASTGWLKFATNFPFIQWGSNVVGAGATVDVTLPVAFPNAHYQDLASFRTTPGDNQAILATPNGNTEVRLVNENVNACTISWLAIGR